MPALVAAYLTTPLRSGPNPCKVRHKSGTSKPSYHLDMTSAAYAAYAACAQYTWEAFLLCHPVRVSIENSLHICCVVFADSCRPLVTFFFNKISFFLFSNLYRIVGFLILLSATATITHSDLTVIFLWLLLTVVAMRMTRTMTTTTRRRRWSTTTNSSSSTMTDRLPIPIS